LLLIIVIGSHQLFGLLHHCTVITTLKVESAVRLLCELLLVVIFVFLLLVTKQLLLSGFFFVPLLLERLFLLLFLLLSCLFGFAGFSFLLFLCNPLFFLHFTFFIYLSFLLALGSLLSFESFLLASSLSRLFFLTAGFSLVCVLFIISFDSKNLVDIRTGINS
jgi:hypothetical protein